MLKHRLTILRIFLHEIVISCKDSFDGFKGSDDNAFDRITGFLDFVRRPVFEELENTTFQKLNVIDFR
jgi:hypothetical protein